MRRSFKESLFRPFFSAVAVFLLTGAAVVLGQAPPNAEVLVLQDGSTPRAFEIAGDELHLSRRGAPPSLERLGTALAPGPLRARARRLAADTGGEVNLVLYPVNGPRNLSTRRFLTRKILVRLGPGRDPGSLLNGAPGVARWRALNYLPDAVLVEAPDATESPALAAALRGRAGVVSAEVELAVQRRPRFVPNDLLFGMQWHLLNTGQLAAQGVDVNITNVWNTYHGNGIVIAIVDDALQTTHPDLSPNYNAALSYDFDDNDPDPNPGTPDDAHGTCCAGIAAARGNNGVGVCGAAFEASLAGIRLIAAPTSDDTEASAMLTNNQAIFVKNNSWGPPDDGADLYSIGPLVTAALAQGTLTGRGGRGTIYVFASGNGLANGDNANYDGYANSIYTIAVGAMNDQGAPSTYGTPGACLAISAPSGDDYRPGICTTDLIGLDGFNNSQTGFDLGDKNYTKYFAGTSASAPLVSGIIALVLQANPNLGWRDVKEILMRTATRNAPSDPDWATNPAGFHFNHKFGAGLVNAGAAVSAALTWTNLPPATNQSVAFNGIGLAIPDNTSAGVNLAFAFTNEALRVEHARLVVDLVHPRRGDIAITLTSPGGMRSRLTEPHGDTNFNFYSWPLTSVRHWGESSAGTWTANFADLSPGETGQVISARLEFFGTPVNPLAAAEAGIREVAGKSNGNGALDPGETVEQRFSLRNTATYGMDALTGTVRTATPGVTLLAAASAFPALAPGATGTNTDAFVYHVARDVPCGTRIRFALVTTNASGSRTNTLTRLVGQATDSAPGTDAVDSADVPKTLPDLATAFSSNTIALPGVRILDDVKVSVRLDHTAVGDLQIALIHPDGSEVVIDEHEGYNDPDLGTGVCGADEQRTVFDDAATATLSSGVAPFTGNWRPDNPLSAFRGKPVNGTWRLRLSDQYSNDSGTLNCWGLQILSHEQTVACAVFNPPPVAANLSLATTLNAPIGGTLTASDQDGDPITFQIAAPPAHGQLSGLNPATGTFTYTPNPNYAGPDSFTYLAGDGNSTSAAATVTIAVHPTAPLFTGFEHLSDGRFVLHVLAPDGPAYVIQSSTNLVDWSALATNSTPAVPFDFVDTAAPADPVRFYRVRQ